MKRWTTSKEGHMSAVHAPVGLYKLGGWTLILILLSTYLLAGCGAPGGAGARDGDDASAASQGQDATGAMVDTNQVVIPTLTPEPSSPAESEPVASAIAETETPAGEPATTDESHQDATITAAAAPAVVAPPDINTVFILDASGSMLADLGNRPRLAAAQDAIGNLSAGLPSSINASLWVYGHRVEKDDQARSCRDIEQVIGLGPVDPQQFDAVAHSFVAKGYTPITDALMQAASSLPVGPNQRNSIVLVSDGEETCGGDPCVLAAELAASDASLVIHTIGLVVDDTIRTQLQCIADVSGGTYTDADSADGLSLALAEAAAAAADDMFTMVEGLGRPSSVVVSADGRNVYVTGAGAKSLLVFSRDPDTGRLTFLEVHVNGTDDVQGMNWPQWLAISPDGRSLYATGGDDLAMAVFSRDPESGALVFVEAVDVFSDVAGVDRSQGVAVSPDNQNVYVTGADNTRKEGAIAVYNRNAETGRLSLVEMIQNGVGGTDGLRDMTAIAVSPDNRNVYALNVWHAMVVFDRDPESGALAFVQMLEDKADGLNNGLLGAHAVVVTSDNRHVYVTSRRRDAITLFDRNPDTGALIFADQLWNRVGDTLSNLDGAHGLAITPDGQHVYVTSDNIDMLLSFSRDLQTGALSLFGEFTDNMNGVDGLKNGWSIAVSPDGRSVYVAGFDDNSLSVFSRDPASGALSFVEIIRNKVGE